MYLNIFYTTIKFLLLGIMVVIVNFFPSFGQSSKQEKIVKRYIRPNVYFNFYGTPNRRNAKVSNGYSFRQSSVGGYFPVFTNNWYQKDEVSISSFHLLAQGSLMSSKPYIEALDDKQHHLYRVSIGLTGILATGNKNIWYASFQPFVSQDRSTFQEPVWRMAGLILFNRTVSSNFSYRIGLLRTYMFGDNIRNNLPIVGFRFGRLDKLHLNLYLIRNISLNIPLKNNLWMEVFAKPIGGLYIFSNSDSLFKSKAPVQFGRYEILNGVGFTYRPNSSLTMFVNTGFSHNKMVFLKNKEEGRVLNLKPGPSLFINFGINIALGQSKSIQNNTEMYDVFSIHNNWSGNNLNGTSNTNIPANTNYSDIEKINKTKYMEVKDLLFDEL